MRPALYQSIASGTTLRFGRLPGKSNNICVALNTSLPTNARIDISSDQFLKKVKWFDHPISASGNAVPTTVRFASPISLVTPPLAVLYIISPLSFKPTYSGRKKLPVDSPTIIPVVQFEPPTKPRPETHPS